MNEHVKNPMLERGQAIIECVVFSFFAMLIALAACEGAKYCFAQASAEAVATEACRLVAANPETSSDTIKTKSLLAAPNIGNCTITCAPATNTESKTYTHHLNDGSKTVDRSSNVETRKYTITVTVKCSYMTGLGKIMQIAGGTDSYTVKSIHSLDIDTTAVPNTEGSSSW